MCVEKKSRNGYIIKLYKSVPSCSMNIPSQSDFTMWMNFDGMRVIPVCNFDDYKNSLDIKELHRLDEMSERQKLYLYHVDAGRDIFGLDEGEEIKEFPLIVVSLINFQQDVPNEAEFMKTISKVVEMCDRVITSAVCSELVRYELMKTLSSHDYVLVFRGKSFDMINLILFGIRKKLFGTKNVIGKVYSIIGIDSKNTEKWTEDKEIYASIRIALGSDKHPYELYREFTEINHDGEIITEPQMYMTYGKFDMGVEGYLPENKRPFLELFSERSIFALDGGEVFMTNTRFLNKKREEIKLLENKIEEAIQTESDGGTIPGGTLDNDAAKKILEGIHEKIDEERKIVENSSISDKLKQSVLRLILRVNQSRISIYSRRYSEEFDGLLRELLWIIETKEPLQDKQQTIADIVTSMNILLDNKISANTRDFETPNSNLRFTGSSSKMLMMYTNIVEDMAAIIRRYHVIKGEPDCRYTVFVTADIDSKITVNRFFPELEKRYFLNVRIPIDLMFYTRYAIPWLIHETGHFIRVSWSREARNRAFFQSMMTDLYLYKAAIKNEENGRKKYKFDLGKIERYLKNSVKQGTENLCNRKCCPDAPKCRMADRCRGRELAVYNAKLCDYLVMKIYETREVEDFYYFRYEDWGRTIKNVREMGLQIKNAYEEAIADIFMIKMLNLTSPFEYLEIILEYLQNNNMIDLGNPQKNLDMNIAIRIDAIVEFMQSGFLKMENAELEKMTAEYPEIQKRKLLQLYRLLRSIENESAISISLPLRGFLDYVGKGMDQLLQDSKVRNISFHVRERYRDIVAHPDQFSVYINCIEEFQYPHI